MGRLTVYIVSALIVALAATGTRGDEIMNPERRCRHQIEGLRSCERYLRDSSSFQPGGGVWRQEFPRCCEKLEQIDEQCRCDAVKQVVEEQRRLGTLQGREMEEMLLTAQSLPALCRIQPHHYCHNIRADAMF